MSELMKKPHIDIVELKFLGPVNKRHEVVDLMKSMGFVDTTELVDWRECFPEVTDENLPGYCLRGARGREEITQKELAQITGIPQRHISEMERGKRPIGKETAKKLAKALSTNYKVFL